MSNETKTVDLTKGHSRASKNWEGAEFAYLDREFERVYGHQPNDAERRATAEAHDRKIGR